MSKHRLGRGLDSLLQDIDNSRYASQDNSSQSGILEVELSRIEPNPEQPRKNFDPQALAELVASVKEKGVIQPLLLQRNGKNSENQDEYLIVAGERRYRAATEAGLTKVPAIVRDYSPQEVLEIALIENIQRSDLSALEEAKAYRQLMDDHGLGQEEVARKLGKSRPVIANALRLLKLPHEVQEMLELGQLSQGHARALLGGDQEADSIRALAERVVSQGLSVRETEKLVRQEKAAAEGQRSRGSGAPGASGTSEAGSPPDSPAGGRDPYIWDLEEKLIRALATKAEVQGSLSSGKIVIRYYSKEDLLRISDTLLGDS